MDINEAWKSACKVLIGGEIGELDRYAGYLSRNVSLTLREEKSALSGKPTYSSSVYLKPGAKFISNDEIPAYESSIKGMKLDINEIKDLDSIISALGERFSYSGSIILGKCTDIRASDRCTDSSFVYRSQEVTDKSKFVAFSRMVRNCEYAFGSEMPAESKFIISGFQNFRAARCLENILASDVSDCYYVANVHGSKNCMFSFNLRSKSHAIGNLELPKEKYAQLKEKLLEDIRTTLEGKKVLPSLSEIISAPHSFPVKAASPSRESVPSLGMDNKLGSAKIEKEFQSTTAVILGKALKGIDDYRAWLTKSCPEGTIKKSAISEARCFIAPVEFYRRLTGGVISFDEAQELASARISEKDAEGLTLLNAASILDRIRYASVEQRYWTNNYDIVECASFGNGTGNAYHSSFAYSTKNAAYSYFPKFSENVFGCRWTLYSKFCINCHDSTNLARCFEVSDSSNCTDLYFSHNCENVQDSMFCFNAKSKRYAIGNVEVGKENYLKIRKMVLEDVVKRLEKDKSLDVNIYGLGCK